MGLLGACHFVRLPRTFDGLDCLMNIRLILLALSDRVPGAHLIAGDSGSLFTGFCEGRGVEG